MAFYPGQPDYIDELNSITGGTGGSGSNFNNLTAVLPIVATGNSTAKSISINPASTSAAGSMSATDKAKLDNLPNSFSGTGDVTMGGSQTLTNKTLTNPAITKQTLVDATTVAWNMDNGCIAEVTITANRTMGLPTNLKIGAPIKLIVRQGGAGSFSLTWNAIWKWGGNTAPTLSTAAGAYDLVEGVYDGTSIIAYVSFKSAVAAAPPPAPAGNYPTDAWAGGKEGFWIDPDDLNSMTQPGGALVTTHDQWIDTFLDKSGNGNHLYRPSAFALYKDEAFDNAFLYNGYTAYAAGGSTTGFFLCIALKATAWFWNKRILFSDRSSANIGLDIIWGADNRLAVDYGNGSARTVLLGGAPTELIDQAGVFTIWIEGSNFMMQLNNGVITAAGFTGLAAGHTSCTLMSAFQSEVNVFEGNLYSAVYVKDSTLSSAARAAIKTAVGAKAGIAL